jgi:carbamoyltransferase
LTAILGLNAYHADSAAALVVDGKLVAAAEEERFRRVKHWAGLPLQALQYCLREGRLRLSDVEHLAVNSDPSANILRKVGYTLRHRPDARIVADRMRSASHRRSVESKLVELMPGESFRGRTHRVNHHLAHLASAFLLSPFDEAAVVSVDGFGDFASAAWGPGRGTHVAIEGQVYYPHSLGIFYETITHFLGFKRYGDEYKVMGLAAGGETRYLPEMRKLLLLSPDGTYRLGLDYFHHHQKKVDFRWDGCEPVAGDYYTPAMEALLGPARDPQEPLTQRHKDLARSGQAAYEEAFFHLLRSLHQRYGSDNLALAGGCAYNSVANGRVYQQTPFRRLYVHPAAGDAGGAIGAALAVWHRLDGTATRDSMNHAYWGPSFSDAELAALVQARGAELAANDCRVEAVHEAETLYARTAEAIARGCVIGWFQGRMEWGPRALGNRSILCDPRRSDMKELLNAKIKRRESFRPFAPSILREHVAEWFETDDDVPFMTQVYQIREEQRARIPAVTHVDGSGRLQTVTREQNPRYYELIAAFGRRTQVPMLLNTSFNENEPVVCAPPEALDCFLRTKMDVLVLGNWLIERRPQGGSSAAGGWSDV